MLRRKWLRPWHAVLAGGFLIAWATGDEDTYSMHVFAGYVVLAAIVARLVAALAGRSLRLPGKGWFGRLAAAVLAGVGLAAVSGALADAVLWLEDPHEALSHLALWLVLGHLALVVWTHLGRRWLATASAVLMLIPALAAHAAEPRAALLDRVAAEARATDPAFAGFSAARGEALYLTRWAGGDERTPSCATCHGADPRQPGRNAKTGRPIGPVAVSADPRRFTDPDEVGKHFARDCKSVLGRACTALERGDYITFMAGR